MSASALTCTCTRCGDTSLTVDAAAAYVDAHGRLPACACESTRSTAKPRSDGEIDEHGERGYWRGCKCDDCRAGHAAYQRAYRARGAQQAAVS